MTPLEQKIRKHCPELQALTFGCEVKRFENTPKEVFICDGTVLRESTGQIFGFDREDPMKIIGHPIEWSHVLRAIEKSGKYALMEKGIAITPSGQILDFNKEKCGTDMFIDLSLPFSQQSPEVHKFINDLID